MTLLLPYEDEVNVTFKANSGAAVVVGTFEFPSQVNLSGLSLYCIARVNIKQTLHRTSP